MSELIQSGSSKNLALYSCSVGLGHGPESEVMLLSFFQAVNTPGSFWGTCFPSLTSFFQGQNFSVHFSMSSTKVRLPVWVLTLRIRSIASSGKSQVKKPYQSHTWNSETWPCYLREYNIIASCLFYFEKFSIIIISNAEISRFWN